MNSNMKIFLHIHTTYMPNFTRLKSFPDVEHVIKAICQEFTSLLVPLEEEELSSKC